MAVTETAIQGAVAAARPAQPKAARDEKLQRVLILVVVA